MDYYLPITNPDITAVSDMWYRQSGDMDYSAIPFGSWWIGLTVKKLSKDFGGITFYNKIIIPNLPAGFTILENSDDYVFKIGDRYYREDGGTWGTITGWKGKRVGYLKEINSYKYLLVAVPNKVINKKYPPIPEGCSLLERDEAWEYRFKKGDFFLNRGNKWEEVDYYVDKLVKDEIGQYNPLLVAVKILQENKHEPKQDNYLELTAPEYKLESNIEYFYTMDGEPKFHKLSGHSGRNLKRVLSEIDNRIKIYIRKPRFENNRPFPHGY